MILLVNISLVMTTCYGLLMRWYGLNWNLIEESKICQNLPTVNLLVPFRNEAHNLPKLIEALNTLDYPRDKLSVLFLNDHSTDDFETIFEKYQLVFESKIIHLAGNEKGKKAAIRKAWRLINTEVVVHTDADCFFGKSWLKTMVEQLQNGNCKFVSGPVQFTSDGSFFQNLMRLEFAGLIGIGAAHIAGKRPLICNGANLAYRADVLREKMNLKENQASGEDVFLMESIEKKWPGTVEFVKNKKAIVVTLPPQNVKDFISQRIRWASKNTGYGSFRNTMLLFIAWLFNVLLIVNLFSFSAIGVTVFCFMLVIKLISELNFYSKISDIFGLKDYLKNTFLGQPFHILYVTFVPIISQLVSYQWKGRKLK